MKVIQLKPKQLEVLRAAQDELIKVGARFDDLNARRSKLFEVVAESHDVDTATNQVVFDLEHGAMQVVPKPGLEGQEQEAPEVDWDRDSDEG